MTILMFQGPPSVVFPFTVTCKGCGQNIAAPVETMPAQWIIAERPLCEDKRRYLPTDIFRGKLSYEFTKRVRTAGRA